MKSGVQLTIEMRFPFETFVESTVRNAIAYAIDTKSHVQVSPHLVLGIF